MLKLVDISAAGPGRRVSRLVTDDSGRPARSGPGPRARGLGYLKVGWVIWRARESDELPTSDIVNHFFMFGYGSIHYSIEAELRSPFFLQSDTDTWKK